MAGKFAVFAVVLSAATISACTYDLKIDANGFTCTTASDCPSGYRCENSTSQHPGICCNLPDSRSCLPPTGSDGSIDVVSSGGQGDASLSSGGTGGLRTDGGGTSDVPIATGGATGGRAGTGGITDSGGLTGSGAIAGSGGLAGAGGITGSGGLTGSGGTSGGGGVVGTGGIVSTGGSVGTGGTIVPGLAVFVGVPSGQGSADGTGAAARFNWPSGVAVDGAGNLFVADLVYNTIRKITPAGVVTTLAGTAGLYGTADGTGAAARFNAPTGVAVDGAGNVFVTEQNNNAIRKITPSGVVTTLAGSGDPGSENGTGAAARFYEPYGVAVDGAGNVFVADMGNNTIRKITPAGVVTTLAGGANGSADGTGAAACFNGPLGVAVDGAGNVFVADAGNNTIRKITPAGVVTTLAGSAGSSGSANGTGAVARFNYPQGVGVDGAGNAFVVDSSNNAIRKITPAGVVTTLAGSAGSPGSADGTGAAARFGWPIGVALDGAGNLFVTDGSIRKITPAGVVTTFAGTAGSSASADGTGTAARFASPSGVAVDGAGDIFVADTDNNTIRKITPAGVVTTLAGTAGSHGSADGTGAAARFSISFDPNLDASVNGSLSGVAVDGAGNVFVADTYNNTIRKITPAGVVTTLAGSAGLSGSADGTGATATFDGPSGVAVDGAGSVFVADTDSNTIRKITPSGVVTTLAGTAGSFGSADGTGAAATFNGPSGVAVDGAGNVFVADYWNNTIRKVTPTGVVTTLAGTAGSPYGSADGTGAAARFNTPSGVAVDGAGNVFVADTGNNAIRKISTSGVVTTIVGVAAPVSAGNIPGPLPASILSPDGVAIDPSSGKLYITLPDAVMVAVFNH